MRIACLLIAVGSLQVVQPSVVILIHNDDSIEERENIKGWDVVFGLSAEGFDVEIVAIANHVECGHHFLIATDVERGVFLAVSEEFDVGPMGKFNMFLFSEVFVVEVNLIPCN